MNSNAALKNHDFATAETEQDLTRSQTLIIGKDEMLKINISNKLTTLLKNSITTKDKLEDAIEFLTHQNTFMVVFDIDDIEPQYIERVYKLINHLQIPCLITSSDSNFLNKLRLELDNTYISFLPKSILNSMFNETIKLLLQKNAPTKNLTRRIFKTSSLPKTKTVYLLAAFLFCEPIIKVLYLKFLTGFEWEILYRTIFSIDGVFKNFEFWGLFPLAGYALLSVRSWSFLFFIGLQVYNIYAFSVYEKFTWPYVAESPHISSSFLLITNLVIITYFLVPAHLRPYWNETRKIWRNTTRFATNIQALFRHHNKSINTTITNISETGAYFTATQPLEIGHKMQLEIPVNGQMKSIDAVVRRTQPTAHQKYTGYGVEFNYKNSQEKKDLKSYIETLTHRIQ